jgi:hypothetical protein
MTHCWLIRIWWFILMTHFHDDVIMRSRMVVLLDTPPTQCYFSPFTFRPRLKHDSSWLIGWGESSAAAATPFRWRHLFLYDSSRLLLAWAACLSSIQLVTWLTAADDLLPVCRWLIATSPPAPLWGPQWLIQMTHSDQLCTMAFHLNRKWPIGLLNDLIWPAPVGQSTPRDLTWPQQKK